MDESEKKEILSCLPEHIHPQAESSQDGLEAEARISPLPHEFLRYSNNWRGGVRQFQIDLQCGRYDPEWLRQAEEARRERAEGKFDMWKEKEFEQFWGQKQKLDQAAIAGEGSQVKLATLVDDGVVQMGDIWTYSRAFFIGEEPDRTRVLVEKEVKVCWLARCCPLLDV